VFRSSAEQELVHECVHEKTQNPNESFNRVIWNRVPKNVFACYKTFAEHVYVVVLALADGNVGQVRVPQQLRINHQINNCQETDNQYSKV
jgi:hypothetical protein